MAEPFLSEIRLMSFSFPPRGWAYCNGQLLPINQNIALFSLLGTTFGGDGIVNFALPDLRGRVPMHVGNGHTLGERAGEQAVTLNQQSMPQHTHVLRVSTASAAGTGAAGNVTGAVPDQAFKAPQETVAMAADAVTNVGGSQAHLNMQPFLTISFCIALQGIFPSPT